jgi:predicted dinucleotide-utilizing enzyme
VAGVELAGVFARSEVPARFRPGTLDELIERSELVVEAASQEFVRDSGRRWNERSEGL